MRGSAPHVGALNLADTAPVSPRSQWTLPGESTELALTEDPGVHSAPTSGAGKRRHLQGPPLRRRRGHSRDV